MMVTTRVATMGTRPAATCVSAVVEAQDSLDEWQCAQGAWLPCWSLQRASQAVLRLRAPWLRCGRTCSTSNFRSRGDCQHHRQPT